MTISLAPVSNGLAVDENTNTLFSPVGRELSGPPSRLSGASSCKPFDPDRHFLPCADSYHSGRVIARSASPRRYAGKWRALARATSVSLIDPEPQVRRVGARAVSDNRTYRRLGTEQKGHGNSGETEAQCLSETLQKPLRVKAALVGNLGETVLPRKKKKNQLILEFEQKRICERCKKNLTYMNLDICEPCVCDIAGL
jgi:hypothetical protein